MIRNTKMKTYLIALMALGFVSLKAYAVPVLGEVWGATVSNPNPVWNATSIGPEIFPTAVGSPTVTLTFPTGGFSPAARMFATAVTYNGNYASYGGYLNMQFTFDPSVIPVANGLQFYFKSGANDIWYANGFTMVPSLLAQNYSFNIGSAAAWDPDPLNTMAWSAGFGNVTEIGFEVYGQNGGLQTFDFSNMQLTLEVPAQAVPEPETVWMIMMVLASLALTFRSRLGELAGQVKARIKA